MTFLDVSEIDEMVCSALSEIANIMSGSASSRLADRGYTTDITAPALTLHQPPACINQLQQQLRIVTPLGPLVLGTTFTN